MNDPVEHPKHYTSHPSGIECIQITEHMGFNLGNALKYIWRADLKNDAIEDLKKARWYIERELAKRGVSEQSVDTTATTDGWIAWKGGECPYAHRVKIKLRNGNKNKGNGINFWWYHDNEATDIVAYRIVK